MAAGSGGHTQPVHNAMMTEPGTGKATASATARSRSPDAQGREHPFPLTPS